MRRHIREHVKSPYQFVCYTDLNFPLDGEIRPLKNNWPGYWSKIEIFREIEDSFYIDLDMTISSDITDIVKRESNFCALRNMTPSIAGIGSAMMRWSGDHRYMYDNFMFDVRGHMADNSKIGTPYFGDQGFIYRQVKNIELFQELFPGRIERFDQNKGASIKVYYGRYRPWK